LNFKPEPQGQGSLRPTFAKRLRIGDNFLLTGFGLGWSLVARTVSVGVISMSPVPLPSFTVPAVVLFAIILFSILIRHKIYFHLFAGN